MFQYRLMHFQQHYRKKEILAIQITARREKLMQDAFHLAISKIQTGNLKRGLPATSF
jgi:hypothetical protein